MWYLGFTCSRARFFKLVQSWLWHFKPTRTVKKFGWLPWNWRVKTTKIREQGMMSYSQVFSVFLWILEKNSLESRQIVIKRGTKVLSPSLPQARLRAVCLLLENAKKKQHHACRHTRSHANSHAHSHVSTLTCFCVFPHGFPSKKRDYSQTSI